MAALTPGRVAEVNLLRAIEVVEAAKEQSAGMVGASSGNSLDADRPAFLEGVRVGAQDEFRGRRGEGSETGDGEVFVVQRGIISDDALRLHPTDVSYWRMYRERAVTYLPDNREHPRLVVVVPVRAYTQVHFVRVSIRLVAGSELEDAEARETPLALSFWLPQINASILTYLQVPMALVPMFLHKAAIRSCRLHRVTHVPAVVILLLLAPRWDDIWAILFAMVVRGGKMFSLHRSEAECS